MSDYAASAWRKLIRQVVARVWPTLKDGAAWVEAQVQVESSGNPNAVSPCGAMGLLQLMPGTADEMGVVDPFDPGQNLAGGVRYLHDQFDHLSEIPTEEERLCWAFASYNGGRGYVNRALKLAQMDGEQFWWKWDVGSMRLSSPQCTVAGRHPAYRQVWAYVERIRAQRGIAA